MGFATAPWLPFSAISKLVEQPFRRRSTYWYHPQAANLLPKLWSRSSKSCPKFRREADVKAFRSQVVTEIDEKWRFEAGPDTI